MMNRITVFYMISGLAWGQCDSNSDGQLDSLDIVDEVNCILENCFENSAYILDSKLSKYFLKFVFLFAESSFSSAAIFFAFIKNVLK